MENTEELVAVRDLLQKKNQELANTRELARSLLDSYKGVLRHGGAQLAANRETNPLIKTAEDMLGVLR
jgi:hypothetical protein